MDKETIAAVTALLSAIFGAKPLWNLINRSWERFLERREVETYLEMMNHLRDLQRKMDDLCDETEATKVIIFAGHNSGGLPRPSSRYYTSSVHWKVEEEYEDQMNEYRNIPVDPAYIDMLLKSKENFAYQFTPSEEKDCKLKRFYEMEGVTDSMIYFLDISDNNFLYMSIATHSEGGFSQKDLTKIEVRAHSIRDTVIEANKTNKSK